MAETGLITAAWTAGAFIFLAAVCGISRAKRYQNIKTQIAKATE